MSKIYLVALVALLCVSQIQAQTGNVSVVLNTIRYSNATNGEVISQNREQIDFAYRIGEWEDENVTADTNWLYSYEGEDTYELNTEEGDQIFITPQQLGYDIPAILGTVTGTNNGENVTIADTIGYSVAQTYHGNQDQPSVSNAAANAANALQVAANNTEAYIQNSTQSAIDALNQVLANAAPSALAPYLLVDQQYREALQNLQNSYSQALFNLSSAYNKVRSAAGNAAQGAVGAAQNAANQAGQAVGSTVNNAQQAASQAGQAVASAPQRAVGAAQNAANQAGQAVGSAVNNAQQAANNAQNAVASAPQRAVGAAQNAANQAGQAVGTVANGVNNAQNAAQSVGTAFNNGVNSASGNQ